MAERGENLGLTLEPRHAVSVTGECFGQDLDGYVAAELWIVGTVNLAHPARTNSACDLIGAHVGARGQSHFAGGL